MKQISIIILLVLLTSCAGVIPSFSDSNQSAAIIDLRQSIVNLDCKQPHLPQIIEIKKDIQWFKLYSEAKPRQTDVLRLVEPIDQTTNDFFNRTVEKGDGSAFYCNTKKKILDEQSLRAAEAVLRRF